MRAPIDLFPELDTVARRPVNLARHLGPTDPQSAAEAWGVAGSLFLATSALLELEAERRGLVEDTDPTPNRENIVTDLVERRRNRQGGDDDQD